MTKLPPCWLLLLGLTMPAHALEWHGLLDMRAINAHGERGWLEAGLGKQRFDSQHDGLRLGQAMLQARGELADELTGTAVLNASDDRRGVLDITEAYLQWKPIPSSPWRSRWKAGAFFPALSLENDGLGWTTTRTQSASALNSWIGEELRTIGLEYTLSRPGRLVGSAHDLGFTAAVFKGNDPAGTLLAWRGWAIGDRITGLRETLQLADLPVYQATGRIARQDDQLDNFRELDGRYGYYAGLQYGYAGKLQLAALHYDNRGDPLIVKRGQYAWDTHFSHLSLRYQPDEQWEFLAQTLAGKTSMGRRAVYLGYRAWYALLGRQLGQGKAAVRYDHFRNRQDDRLPDDNNDENGHGLTLSYSHPLGDGLSLSGEWLSVHSHRPARLQIGAPADNHDQSFSLALRWQF